ncbi:MAG: methyltransferase domain-containing protein [Planctomycetota bacterium]|nr:methyltransferase domain-containing protein [Planctomycetota bacterium]
MTQDELREKMKAYRFYHIMPVAEGLMTPGNPTHVASQQPVLKMLETIDFSGKRVLDIGCRDGLYSFTAERRGAAEVIGIDNCLSQGAVEFLIPHFKSSVKMYERNLLDLKPEDYGRFDVIIFAGVLYHLRYPMWSLNLIRNLCNPGALVVIETAIMYGFPKFAMLYCPLASEGPYGQSSPTFFNKKGLLDTLKSVGFQVHSYATLHPDAVATHANGNEPVVDRAILLCQPDEAAENDQLYAYFNRTHSTYKLKP